MRSCEVYPLLSHRIRRGLVIWAILSSASVIVLLVASTQSAPWAISAFLIGIYCFVASLHVRRRNAQAYLVSMNPQLVYWAHPTSPHASLSEESVSECRLLMLHLRDGTQFEVSLPPEKMQSFVSWLVAENSTVKVGSYDVSAGERTSKGSRTSKENIKGVREHQRRTSKGSGVFD